MSKPEEKTLSQMYVDSVVELAEAKASIAELESELERALDRRQGITASVMALREAIEFANPDGKAVRSSSTRK